MPTYRVFPIAPLSSDQSALLVDLSLAAARTLGFDGTYDGGAALTSATPSGPVLGLTNLARTVARYDRNQWPVLIHEHFSRVLVQLRQGPPAPPADPANQLIQRLVPRAALPAKWTADHADFLPGLVSAPAAVNHGAVTLYLDPATDLDLTWSAAEGFGLANLRKVSTGVEYEEYNGGVRIAFVTGAPFAASKALVLDTVLRDSLHVDVPQYGVLVALPASDVLMIHVIENLSVIPALGRLLNLAARFHGTGLSPLTPDVYWVSPEQTWHPATVTPSGTSVCLSPELRTLTLALAERDPSSGRGTTR